MAKFYGPIGFSISTEIKRGIWAPKIQERMYAGDVITKSFKYQNSGEVNDNVNLSKRISIVADSFVNENLGTIRYVVYKGAKWKVTDIDIQYPRLILTIGGVYNGENGARAIS